MDYFTVSETGGREKNEDRTSCFETGGRQVFLLADGLGGHRYGEIAAEEAVRTVRAYFDEAAEAPEHCIAEAFRAAHNRLKEMQAQVGSDTYFKTTLVALVVSETECVWAHIGDSRLYHFENRRLIERSMDHSVPQMLVNAGKLRERRIRYHEDRSRLLRVLGAEEENSRADVAAPEPRTPQSAFLLCSDGFWELVDERHMEKALRKAQTPEAWISEMEKTVLRNGAKKREMDNYSAIGIYL